MVESEDQQAQRPHTLKVTSAAAGEDTFGFKREWAMTLDSFLTLKLYQFNHKLLRSP